MNSEDLAEKCDELCAHWMDVWELARKAEKLPGGPSVEEVDRAMDAAFAWHDMAELVRNGK